MTDNRYNHTKPIAPRKLVAVSDVVLPTKQLDLFSNNSPSINIKVDDSYLDYLMNNSEISHVEYHRRQGDKEIEQTKTVNYKIIEGPDGRQYVEMDALHHMDGIKRHFLNFNIENMFAPKILSPELKDENGVAIDNNWWDTIKQIVSLTLKASLKTCLNMGILVAVTFGSINLAHTIAPNRVSDPFDLLASIETVKLSPEGVEFSREKEDDITSITKRISANKIQIDALSKSQVALIQQIKTYKSLGLDYRDTANAEKLISAKLLSVNANNLKLISELEKKFGKKINFDVKLYNRPDKALSP